MTVKELKELLLSYPEEAIIYVEADHGQCPYQANFISRTNVDSLTLDYDGTDIDFSEEEDFVDDEVTAIVIN